VSVRYKSVRDLPPHLRPAANDPGFDAQSPSKYRNVPVTFDGVRFPSKAQAARYRELKQQAAVGLILGHVSEVSMRLPGGKRIRLDELVNEWVPYPCLHCGLDNLIPTLVLEDTKGYVTKEWEVKRAVLEAVLGVKIRLISRTKAGRRVG
jgi:hypothetical protein